MNKKDKRKTARMSELLASTMEHFNDGNRGLDPNDSDICQYTPTEKSKGCAIGRCLSKKDLRVIKDERLNGNSIDTLIDREGLGLSKLRGLSTNFLTDLQMLHDRSDNWNREGLSSDGRGSAKQIKEGIKCQSYLNDKNSA
jgi:hypothetical protein